MFDIFLDVVDAGVTDTNRSDLLGFLAILAVTVAAEAGIMLLMKYNKAGKAFLDSAIVNIVSVAAGYVLIRYLPEWFNSYTIPNLLKLMLITIAVETTVLWLLNRGKAPANTISVSAVMNVVSYIIFYLFIQFVF